MLNTPRLQFQFDIDIPEKKKHPAKYSDSLLPIMVGILKGCQSVLDPFAGTGKLEYLRHFLPETRIVTVELEPEWATMIVGNTLSLPFGDATFEAVCTSPTYGNRMADVTYNSQSGNKWQTYACKIGRKLHKDNSGAMQWGDSYRDFHINAWAEIARVIKPDGMLILNMKDHIRNGQLMKVTDWHIDTLLSAGFDVIEYVKVETPSMRYGRNSEKRVPYESVIKFKKSMTGQ